jgi:hypothetical protein
MWLAYSTNIRSTTFLILLLLCKENILRISLKIVELFSDFGVFNSLEPAENSTGYRRLNPHSFSADCMREERF